MYHPVPVPVAAVFTGDETRERPECPSMAECTEERWHVVSVMNREDILTSAATGTDLEGTELCEISRTEKGKCRVTSLICGIQTKAKAKQANKQTELTETRNRLVVARGDRGRAVLSWAATSHPSRTRKRLLGPAPGAQAQPRCGSHSHRPWRQGVLEQPGHLILPVWLVRPRQPVGCALWP